MKATLFLMIIALSSVAQTTLIKWGSPWKYLAQGSAAPSNWNTSSYSDAAWPSGNAQLGFGDGDEATVTPQVVSGATVVTTYFRKSINVVTPKTLEVRMLVDDGAVVYVNGVEVYRYNLPSGSILYSTLTPTFTENQMVKFNIPASNFVPGANIVAVEVHQNTVTSSDLSFNFDLTSSLLVDYNYPFSSNSSDPVAINAINWGADFYLPSRFINSWQNIFSYWAWDNPIKHGFTHTQSWISNPSITPVEKRDKQWGGPGCSGLGANWFALNRTSVAAYNELYDKLKYGFKTGQNVSAVESPVGSGTYVCPTITSVGTYTTNANNYDVAVYDSLGTIVRNTGIMSVDYETQNAVERYFGPGNLDAWLMCLKNNNTTGSCATYTAGFGASLYFHMPTPTAFSSLSLNDFKKIFFRTRINELYRPLKAYKSMLSNPSLYNNYGSDIEDPSVFSSYPSVTWAQLTTDPTKINWVYRDTTNFTTFGNHFTNALDIIVSDNYFADGRLGDRSARSGRWLQETVYKMELMKAWFPTKPCLSYVYLKHDFDHTLPKDYHGDVDTLVAEALPIFTMMVGDGNIVWEAEGPGYNNHVYDYYVKGMRRLSHFYSILTPTTVTRYSNYDPVQLRTMQYASEPTYTTSANTFTYGVARGLIKGDSILVAIMNPNAKEGQITKVPISFTNTSYTFKDTVTLIGRQVFLGAAKMTPLGVSTVINSIFENSSSALVYPNPSKSTISIMGLEDTENIKSIVIRDILGREMFVTNKINEINIEGLVTGNYFVSIYSNENVLLKTLRFIKE